MGLVGFLRKVGALKKSDYIFFLNYKINKKNR